MTMLSRRSLLFGAAGLFAAASPAIVRASSLMAISPLPPPTPLRVEAVTVHVAWRIVIDDLDAETVEKLRQSNWLPMSEWYDGSYPPALHMSARLERVVE